MMIIFLVGVQRVILNEAHCRRVARVRRFAGALNVFCFQSFSHWATSQELSEVCFVSTESLMQKQWKYIAIIPICPILLHMELTILNILNQFHCSVAHQITWLFTSPFFCSLMQNIYFIWQALLWLWPKQRIGMILAHFTLNNRSLITPEVVSSAVITEKMSALS